MLPQGPHITAENRYGSPLARPRLAAPGASDTTNPSWHKINSDFRAMAASDLRASRTQEPGLGCARGSRYDLWRRTWHGNLLLRVLHLLLLSHPLSGDTSLDATSLISGWLTVS